MKNEIEIFEMLLFDNDSYLVSSGYVFDRKDVFNENSATSIFIEYCYLNDNLNKTLTFIFYPTGTEYIQSEIGVYITKNESTSIPITTFLAYEEVKRRVTYDDERKHRFKFNPKQLEISIKEQLEKIKKVLTTDLYSILTTDEWLDIPVVDPRDDY